MFDTTLPPLSDEERNRYEWQIWVHGLGEEGQRRLKRSSVLVSRIGGVGGMVAMQLAAAGVGRLIVAHAGDLRLNDLNRQLLMSSTKVGQPRIDQARLRLAEVNPHVAVETVGENVSADNAARLVSGADVVVAAAPLFAERLLLNREAVAQRKPLVDAAMYELEARLLTVRPGRSACLACLYPEPPPLWKREFPVLSAVASTIGCLAAMEVIKLLTGLGTTLDGKLLRCDLGDMSFQTIAIPRRPDCPICGSETG